MFYFYHLSIMTVQLIVELLLQLFYIKHIVKEAVEPNGLLIEGSVYLETRGNY